MCSDAFPFRVIDLNTVKIEELTFQVPFQLTVNRDDYIHAFIVYFDTDFSACHKKVTFGTGPQDKYTHWKQVSIYLLTLRLSFISTIT
jgi:protein arginine N-methyltransferase 1